ncbi:hypothetical protein [Halorussus sp. MSC15.2]|nr:hypothetical protein [Halorussus sp. MSC15.2]
MGRQPLDVPLVDLGLNVISDVFDQPRTERVTLLNPARPMP